MITENGNQQNETANHLSFGNKLAGKDDEGATKQQPVLELNKDKFDHDVKTQNQCLKGITSHPPIDEYMKRIKDKQQVIADAIVPSKDLAVLNQPILQKPVYQIARGELDYMQAQADPMNHNCRDHKFCGVRVGRLS